MPLPLPNLTRSKLTEWLKRYLPAEIFAIIGAILGGSFMHLLFHQPIFTALGGTLGENTGYYGFIIIRDLKTTRPQNLTAILKLIRNLLLEFGAAEYLDSFVIRPTAMYFFPQWLGNLPLGLLAGKLAADITFYIPTIISYELKKKYLRD